MASMWRRAMHYLGLGPDEDYDDYDLLGGTEEPPPAREPVRRRPAVPAQPPEAPGRSAASPNVRTLATSPRPAPGGGEVMNRGTASNGSGPRQLPPERASSAGGSPRPVVRPLAVPPSAKPHVVSPAAFTDAQEVADQFKRSAPVIVNLQGVERDLMRRIIDFSSGLCYGLGGQMERVANHVYLLTPNDVEVSDEERRRLRERGYEA